MKKAIINIVKGEHNNMKNFIKKFLYVELYIICSIVFMVIIEIFAIFYIRLNREQIVKLENIFYAALIVFSFIWGYSSLIKKYVLTNFDKFILLAFNFVLSLIAVVNEYNDSGYFYFINIMAILMYLALIIGHSLKNTVLKLQKDKIKTDSSENES